MKVSGCFLAGIMLCCGTALAELGGSDDFNDNVRDPAKWQLYALDLLSETNGHLEFTSAGFGHEQGTWIWNLNAGSYTQDWVVVVDAVNSCAPISVGNAIIGIAVANSSDFSDVFLAQFVAIVVPIASSGWSINGIPNWAVANHPVSTNAIRLKIAFDSTAKVLSSSYDSGSGFTALTNLYVGGWTMTDTDTFTVAIDGQSDTYAVSPGDLYADNFRALTLPYSAAITNCYVEGEGFNLEWIPLTGWDSMVQYSTNLVSMPFTNLSSALPSSQNSYTDTVHSAEEACFYQVEVVP